MPLPDPERQTPDRSVNSSTAGRSSSIDQLARIIGSAARFSGNATGLSAGERAALARMRPDAMRAHQIAALSRALIEAELTPESWPPATWTRWALIAHGMALAGHDGQRPLGVQLCTADIAENRVTKLVTARGDAFRQFIPKLLRLLASREVAPNWRELAVLILNDGKADKASQEKSEEVRMKIAGRYFSARKANK